MYLICKIVMFIQTAHGVETNLMYLNASAQILKSNISVQNKGNTKGLPSGNKLDENPSSKHTCNYAEVFRKLNILSYAEVKSCEFNDYLLRVRSKKPTAVVTSGSVSEFGSHNDNLTPEKKSKRERFHGSTFKGDDVPNYTNTGEETSETEDSKTSEISLQMLTKCVTHPTVVSLICDLLKDRVVTTE